MWRSLVSRLNGVQEASSSNLDTRTKKVLKLQGFLLKGTKNDQWEKAGTGQAGKRESKRLPLSCFFSLGQKFCSQNGWNLRKKFEIRRKGIVFVTILCYTIYNSRVTRRTLRFPKYRGEEKAQSEDEAMTMHRGTTASFERRVTAFLSYLFSPLGNFTGLLCQKAECVCTLPSCLFRACFSMSERRFQPIKT